MNRAPARIARGLAEKERGGGRLGQRRWNSTRGIELIGLRGNSPLLKLCLLHPSLDAPTRSVRLIILPPVHTQPAGETIRPGNRVGPLSRIGGSEYEELAPFASDSRNNRLESCLNTNSSSPDDEPR